MPYSQYSWKCDGEYPKCSTAAPNEQAARNHRAPVATELPCWRVSTLRSRSSMGRSAVSVAIDPPGVLRSRGPNTTGHQNRMDVRSGTAAVGWSDHGLRHVQDGDALTNPPGARRGRTSSTISAGALVGEPASNGGCGSYSIPSWADCATTGP